MTKFRKTVAILLALVLVLCTGLPAMAAESTDAATNTTADSATTTEVAAVEGKLVEANKYGNLVLDIDPQTILDAGYEYGDIVSLEINGTAYEMPMGTSYSDVDVGSMVLCVVPDSKDDEGNDVPGSVVAAINKGDMASTLEIAVKVVAEDKSVSWTNKDGTAFDPSTVTVKISMAEKGGYAAEYLIHQLTRTNVRDDYASDEIFAPLHTAPAAP